jgi:hypothetical protein
MPTLSARIRFFPLLALAAAPLAQAQYYGQQPYNQQQYNQQQYNQQQYNRQQQYNPQGGDQTILYGTGKNPPPGMVIEQGNAPPGIPMSGVQQQQQLKPNANRYGGPTTVYRDRKGLTVINGPDGTTVCRDVSGRVTVCN